MLDISGRTIAWFLLADQIMQGQKNVGFLKKGPRGCFFSASLKPQTETKKKNQPPHVFPRSAGHLFSS